MVRKYFHYTEEDIAAGKYDAWTLTEPLWKNISIYDGLDKYNSDLAPYTEAQRRMLAMLWYDSEVCNGGHDQFFFNSTGIVWKDALEGFRMIGAKKCAENFQNVIDRFGGQVPFDREERQEVLKALTTDPDDEDGYLDIFGENDSVFYSIDEDYGGLMDEYIKKHPAEFVLDGEYEVFEV